MSYTYNQHMRRRMEELVRKELVLRPDVVKFCISLVQNLEDKFHHEIMSEPAGFSDGRDINERVAQSLLTTIRMAYNDVMKKEKNS